MFVQGAGGDGRVGRVGAGGLAVVGARREPPRAPSALARVAVGVAVGAHHDAAAAAAGACKGGARPGGRLTCGRVVVVALLAVHVERWARRTQATQPAAALQRTRDIISLGKTHDRGGGRSSSQHHHIHTLAHTRKNPFPDPTPTLAGSFSPSKF